MSELQLPTPRDLPAGRLEFRRAHLVRELEGVRAPARRRLRRGLLAPALGSVAATAAAVAVLVGVGAEGDGSANAATRALRDAAAVARTGPGPLEAGAGEYVYTKTISAYLSTTVLSEELSFSVLVPRVRESWLGSEGGQIRERSGKPRFLSAADRRRWVEAGRPSLREPAWKGAASAEGALSLPSNPDDLYRYLERQAAGHPEGVHEEMFTLVGDGLRETRATPGQRAALYEVAARLPGVDLLGRVRDPAGRTGLAVAMEQPADGVRHTLIFDPETSRLLAEQQVTLERNLYGYPEGTVVGYATYVASGVVGKIGERP